MPFIQNIEYQYFIESCQNEKNENKKKVNSGLDTNKNPFFYVALKSSEVGAVIVSLEKKLLHPSPVEYKVPNLLSIFLAYVYAQFTQGALAVIPYEAGFAT